MLYDDIALFDRMDFSAKAFLTFIHLTDPSPMHDRPRLSSTR